MDEKLFEELLESVDEAGAIMRGEKEPSRRFEFEIPDAKLIRQQFKLSQSKFATMLGVSKRTLQNWEQGTRTPTGPARVLLQIAVSHPESVQDVASKAIH